MKKGFTLVELLAVIVILAIILVIAVPGISGIITSSTKGAFQSDAKMLLKAIDYKELNDSSFDPSTVNETNVTTLLGLSSDNYQTIKVTTLRGKPYVTIIGKSKWSGLVASGSLQGMSVTDSGTYTTVVNQLGYDSVKGVNEPKLVTGMTPIKWNGSSWIDTTADDTDWYNYNTSDKKWANVRTADGSMWVWVPRYIYKISSGWHTATSGTIDVQFSKGVDDNWNNASIGNIDAGTTSNASNNKWTNHPGFTFGSTQLTGIWVAKFKATAAEGITNITGSDCAVGDNVTTKTVKVVPNAKAWRCIQVGNMFTSTRNMETNAIYGWGTSGVGIDTHLTKNAEWGATAYLSKSIYGKNTDEIWVNPANDFTTGCAGDSVSPPSTTGCLRAYDTVNGEKASTTGNIYGIYDMSGLAYEYTASYINNGNSDLNNGLSIINAPAQYREAYTKGETDDSATNYSLAVNFKGDAVYETSNAGTGNNSWFTDCSLMPFNNNPWFIRGNTQGTSAGAFCYLSYGFGGQRNVDGFRPILLVESGL